MHSSYNIGAGGLTALVLLLLSSCSTLTIRNVDFGWPVESVQTVSSSNRIEDVRYALSMSAASLAAEEFQDSTALIGKEVRILRSRDGLYFVTGPEFRSVYVFAPSTGELSLTNKLEISPTGMKKPALNQRSPFVELLDGESFRRMLTGDEIIERTNP
ncbi:MAG: hypothetical protein OEM41_02875 [Ignavibacteria bacterium]|nr:hypothetical protein [Ignavibacteria bacterium]